MEGLASLHMVLSPVFGVVILDQYGMTCIITLGSFTCLLAGGPVYWLVVLINMEGLASIHMVLTPVYGVVVIHKYGRTYIITHGSLTGLLYCSP